MTPISPLPTFFITEVLYVSPSPEVTLLLLSESMVFVTSKSPPKPPCVSPVQYSLIVGLLNPVIVCTKSFTFYVDNVVHLHVVASKSNNGPLG